MVKVISALMLLLCGCATQRPPVYFELPAPPTEEVRAQLGTIAIVATATNPATDFTKPMGKGQAAGHGGWVGFWTPVAIGGSGGNAYGAILGLFLSPLTGTIGAIYGATAGMRQEEYNEDCRSLSRAIQDSSMSSRLQTAVADSVRNLTSERIVTTDAQTVLELTPSQIGLTGKVDIEPPLKFQWEMLARLVRVADGAELFSAQFHYDGSVHTLREWAAEQAGLFSREIDAAIPVFTRQLTEQIFLMYPLPDNGVQQRTVPWP